MADDYVKFKNDLGLAEIGIGVTEFKCIGASPPHDHPHIYHEIGKQGFVRCLSIDLTSVDLKRSHWETSSRTSPSANR